MVQTIRIEAASRERAGKGAARATRRAGQVPAVIYGAKQEATLLSLDPRVVMKELHKGGWRSHLYEVAVAGAEPVRTLMREVQFHPVTDRPLHVDFQRLAPGQKIRVLVPVHFTGEDVSAGIKEGGVLNVVRRELEVLVDPDAVPEAFEFEVSELTIGDTLRWSAVKDTFGAEATLGRDFVVATLAPPTVDVEEPLAEAPAVPEAAKQKAAAGKSPAAGGAGKGGAKGAATPAPAPAAKKKK